MFRSMFTEGFFKNLIGFATILLIGIGVTAFAHPAAPDAGKGEVQEATVVR